ncbi:MAG: hypothetical protein ABMA64_04215 [Myxococcota bacterium]
MRWWMVVATMVGALGCKGDCACDACKTAIEVCGEDDTDCADAAAALCESDSGAR